MLTSQKYLIKWINSLIKVFLNNFAIWRGLQNDLLPLIAVGTSLICLFLKHQLFRVCHWNPVDMLSFSNLDCFQPACLSPLILGFIVTETFVQCFTLRTTGHFSSCSLCKAYCHCNRTRDFDQNGYVLNAFTAKLDGKCFSVLGKFFQILKKIY